MTEPSSLWQWSLERFRRETAAHQPTPGCGAAATVAANLGLALVVKGLRISAAKQRGSALSELLEQGEALLQRLGGFADDDMQAFSRYLQASRHPAGTPDSTDREDSLTSAARQACAVPLAAGHACLEALNLAVAAWPLCEELVRSDVQAGAVLIQAGLSAVLLNVDADLPSLEDADSRARALEARQSLQAQCDERYLALQAQMATRAVTLDK